MDEMLAKIFIIAFLVESIVLHEAAHGYVAWLFGDQTARRQGRITFNLIPIPPLDGSHLFKYILPQELRRSYENLGRTGAGFTPNGGRSQTYENR